jgi:6-phosphogluconolactonase (cycloisomerase 2 family)
MRSKRRKIEWAVLAVAVITVGVFAGASPEGTSRLVSVQQLPANMDACANFDQPSAADASTVDSPQEKTLLAELQQEPGAAAPQRAGQGQRGQRGQGAQGEVDDTGGGSFQLPNTTEQLRTTADLRAKGARVPVRTIRDTAPTYSSIAVDVNSNEVIMTDNNLWSYRVFDRLAPTPKNDTDITPPKRIVQGDQTALQFNNGLYVDPVSGDIYSVESDTGDKMERFAREAQNDESPISILHTPHRVYNIAADEQTQELFLTVEFPPQVVVYPKHAKGADAPLRRIMGNETGLDAPHGIAVDEKDHLLFVNTWGHHSDFTVAGTGKFLPPAIQVFALDAKDDAKPLRVIAGDKTQLDWPGGMKFNPENGDLYIANDIGQSVLVFANVAKLNGDVAPTRVIHGPSTRLRNPTGVALDLKNKEVWVSNLGNSSATVYPLMADGDASPLRVIRSAEESKVGVNFGRTAAVTYDPIRQEILVPN